MKEIEDQEIYAKKGKALFLDTEPDDDKHLIEQLDALSEAIPSGTTPNGNLLVVIANGPEALCNKKANYTNGLIESHLEKKGRQDLIDKIAIKINPDETLTLSSGKVKYWESLPTGSSGQDKTFDAYQAEDIAGRTVSMCAEVHAVKGLENAERVYIMPGYNFKMTLPQDPDQLQQLKNKFVVFDQITKEGVSVNQQDISSDNHRQLAALHEVSLDESGNVKTTGITDATTSAVKWNQDYLIPNQIGDAVREEGVVRFTDKKTGELKAKKGFLKDDISGSKLIEVLASAYKIDVSENSKFDKFYENNASLQAIAGKEKLSGEDIYNTIKLFSYYAHENNLKLPAKNDIIVSLMKNDLVTYNADADNKTSFFLERAVDFTIGAGLYMDMIATNADLNAGLIPSMISKGELQEGKHFERAEKVHKMCAFFTPTAEGKLPVKGKGGKFKVDFGSLTPKESRPELSVIQLTEEGNKLLQERAVEQLSSSVDQTREYPNRVNPELMPNPSSPSQLVDRVRDEVLPSKKGPMEAFTEVTSSEEAKEGVARAQKRQDADRQGQGAPKKKDQSKRTPPAHS